MLNIWKIWVQGARYRVQGSGYKAQGSGCEFQRAGSRSKVNGLWLFTRDYLPTLSHVCRFTFHFQGSGLRGQGSRGLSQVPIEFSLPLLLSHSLPLLLSQPLIFSWEMPAFRMVIPCFIQYPNFTVYFWYKTFGCRFSKSLLSILINWFQILGKLFGYRYFSFLFFSHVSNCVIDSCTV